MIGTVRTYNLLSLTALSVTDSEFTYLNDSFFLKTHPGEYSVEQRTTFSGVF